MYTIIVPSLYTFIKQQLNFKASQSEKNPAPIKSVFARLLSKFPFLLAA
jgi:hypothetical protein